MEKQAAKPPVASGSEAKPRWSLSPRNARTVRASFGTVMRPAKDRGTGNPSNPVKVDFEGIIPMANCDCDESDLLLGRLFCFIRDCPDDDLA